MAKETNTVSKKDLTKAVTALVKEYRPKKQITNEELVERIVKPFKLESNDIDDVMQKVEDNGISIVDENGEPAERSLKKEKAVSKKELRDLSAPTGVYACI